jgi:pyrroline-5-carboxylate reductase
MSYQKIGFIGGGRITNIILGGWKRKNISLQNVLVTDSNADVPANLKGKYPEIQISDGIGGFKGTDLLFISVHPPVMAQVLADVKAIVNPNTLVCSLSPKITMAKISEALGGHDQIVRMNPNAPSIVNSGFNPLVFSDRVAPENKNRFLKLMKHLGNCPETKEINIETYAVISAMGPTYLQFQIYEMIETAKSFGLTPDEALIAVTQMTIGAAKTITDSGLPADAVMNLVPVKPMAEDEGTIKGIYQNRLQAIYQKLRS